MQQPNDDGSLKAALSPANIKMLQLTLARKAVAWWDSPLWPLGLLRTEDESRETTLFPGAPLSPALCDNPARGDGHRGASLSIAFLFLHMQQQGKAELLQ